MNVHVSYKLHKTPDIEKEITHQIEKIQKRLQVFRPDLLHLKAVIDDTSAREGTVISLNLRLPSGQLTAQAKASSATAAIKAGFANTVLIVYGSDLFTKSGTKPGFGAKP